MAYRRALVEGMGPAQRLLTRNVRTLLDWTGRRQADLACALGVSQAYVSQMLNGVRPWQVEHLDNIAAFFRVTIPSLFIEGDEDRFERRVHSSDRRTGRDRRRPTRSDARDT